MTKYYLILAALVFAAPSYISVASAEDAVVTEETVTTTEETTTVDCEAIEDEAEKAACVEGQAGEEAPAEEVHEGAAH